MRLSMVTSDAVPAVGGIADYLHGLMTASVDSVQWHLWSSVPSAAAFDAELPYGVTRFAIEPRRLGQRRGDRVPPLRRLNTWLWRRRKGDDAQVLLDRVRATDRPDAVVIGRWCEDAHAWCVACRQMGLPYAVMAYGLELAETIPAGLARARVEDLCRAALVFGCSSQPANLVAELTGGRARAKILFPGIVPERLLPLPAEDCRQVLAGLGVGERPFILAMGRLVQRKGFDLAVQAFARVAGEFGETGLVIAGDGEDRPAVERAVAASGMGPRIRLTGEVTDLQKRALLQSCEFFVMPNRPVSGDLEGFGIVFLEAGLFGKAVIGGNNGGVPDAVLHGETGLLAETPDLDSLAGAMRRLLADRVFRDACGQRGRARVLTSFQWSQLAPGFVEAVRHATAADHRSSPAAARASEPRTITEPRV